MAQFIKNGPDIPDKLLEDLDNGKLVFFCGAGISCNLGLGNFNWLVKEVRKKLALSSEHTFEEPLGISTRDVEQHPDCVLGLIASKTTKEKTKKAIIEALEITEKNVISYKTHESLLKLSQYDEEKFHLITTNQDHGFINAAKNLSIKLDIDSAPKLPPANQKHLRNLVFLHGIIDKKNYPDGSNIIATSADFGNAYLQNGFAARFVVELFKNFTILFIGYSINDPVMRYLVDAFHADGKMDAYILSSYKDEKHKAVLEKQWNLRGIFPILYQEDKTYSLLHNTICKWAEETIDFGRNQIISNHCRFCPKDELLIDKVLWAINDATGETADYFAKHNPSPSIDWLLHFDKKGWISLLAKKLNDSNNSMGNHYRAEKITENLLPWIISNFTSEFQDQTKYRNVLDWVLEKGHLLDIRLKLGIREKLAKKVKDGGKLSPHEKVWDILVNYDPLLLKHRCNPIDYYDDNSNSIGNRFRIISGLTPFLIVLREENHKYCDEPKMSDYARYEIKFPNDFIDVSMANMKQCNCDDYNLLLSEIAFDLALLLKRYYELRALYEPVYDSSRPFEYDDIVSLICPNIAKLDIEDCKYPDEYRLANLLIGLSRDAFKALLEKNLQSAKSLISIWQAINFPIFRRLVLHAMAISDLFSNTEIINYLLADQGYWFWSDSTKIEKDALLKQKINSFDKKQINTLIEFAENKYNQVTTYKNIYAYEFYWLLKCIHDYAPNIQLPDIYEQLNAQFNETEREEVEACWSGEKSDYKEDELLELPVEELYKMLVSEDDESLARERLNCWRNAIGNNYEKAIDLTVFIYEHGELKTIQEQAVFRKNLDALINYEDSWYKLSEILLNLDKTIINSMLSNVAAWFRETTKDLPVKEEELFWQLFDKLANLEINRNGCLDKNIMLQAINSPAGRLTAAIIYRLDKRQLKNNDGIPKEIKNRLKRLLNIERNPKYYSYVLIAQQLVYFYQVDKKWARKNLMSYLNFELNSELAKTIWTGYLCNSAMFPELLTRIREYMVQAIAQRNVFADKTKKALINLFTIASLRYPKRLVRKKTQAIIANFDKEELNAVALSVYNYIGCRVNSKFDNSKQISKLWARKLKNWIMNCWPIMNKELMTDNMVKLWVLTLFYLENDFKEAFTVIKEKGLFAPMRETFYILSQIKDSSCLSNYPDEVVELLSNIILDEKGWHSGLGDVLQAIDGPRLSESKLEDFNKLKNIADKFRPSSGLCLADR